MGEVIVVGMGPGAREHMTLAALEAIENADVLLGAMRHLALFQDKAKRSLPLQGPLEQCASQVAELAQTQRVAVLVSGDPGLYSLLPVLKRHLPPEAIRVVPGISSVQYLFSALCKSHENVSVHSCHGRDLDDCMRAATSGLRSVVLTDAANNPYVIARWLVDNGFGGYSVTIGERLAYEDQRIRRYRADQVPDQEYMVSVVLIERE